MAAAAAASSSRIISSSTTGFASKLQLHKRGLQVIRASLSHESFRDEEGCRKSRNQVDIEANMRVLRERMEVVRAKESLNRRFEAYDDRRRRLEEAGWTYVAGYEPQMKRKKYADEFVEVLMIVCRTLGFTVAGGTLCLCLISSILLHFNQ